MKLTDIRGLGKKKEEALGIMGISSVKDLLDYYPRTYEDYGKSEDIGHVASGTKAIIEATFVKSQRTRYVRSNLKITKLEFDQEGSVFYATFFNNPYIEKALKRGEKYRLYGTVKKEGRNVEILSPKYSPAGSESVIKQGINPVYPLSTKTTLTNRDFRSFISYALDGMKIKDPIPGWLRDEENLISLPQAYELIHRPESIEDVRKANERITFDEFVSLNLSLYLNRKMNIDRKGAVLDVSLRKDFEKLLPFTLTGAQKRVMDEMDTDLTSGKKMNRLVQGDVGSGKTAVAFYALYQCAKNGFQAAMTAPTRILAQQHYQLISELFEGTGINAVLLVSGMKKAERAEVLEMIRDGRADIVIGTHSVFSEDVEYRNLCLCIIDEQHRFGVTQRGVLSKKGESVHTVVMSATPIPRTLTLAFYRDLDVSIIDEKPAGRKEIKTFLRDASASDNIYRFVLSEVRKGNQAYVVCPSIESEDYAAAETRYEELKKRFFRNESIALLHGRMDEAEKDRIMQEFYEGKISVLVATSIVEVGIDSPNATVMVIEGAERFGLASLHQLRGRVGRGDRQSYCILINENPTKKSMERLECMCRTNDGFKLAVFDLKNRGAGDILGTRQSGRDGYDVYRLIENSELFSRAMKALEEIMDDNTRENRTYLDYVKNRYMNRVRNITWN